MVEKNQFTLRTFTRFVYPGFSPIYYFYWKQSGTVFFPIFMARKMRKKLIKIITGRKERKKKNFYIILIWFINLFPGDDEKRLRFFQHWKKLFPLFKEENTSLSFHLINFWPYKKGKFLTINTFMSLKQVINCKSFWTVKLPINL